MFAETKKLHHTHNTSHKHTSDNEKGRFKCFKFVKFLVGFCVLENKIIVKATNLLM